MTRPVRIANCSGFYGDRLGAASEMVADGPIDFLTGDWLAELTMLILAKSRAKRPGGGYASTFVTQMEQVLGTCAEKGIRVVSNGGGLAPEGCAEAVAKIIKGQGLPLKVAYVTGDDLMGRLDELNLPQDGLITANAYLGGWGIVEALAQGADVVVTGRITDAALVSGPAAWHHGWKRDDWDCLAGSVVAGHIIECGTQATGGNYSFFSEVQGLERAGFPWVEVAADGSSVIGKHEGTGGEVSIGTVTSQLLYEIGSPMYLGPDVITDFSTVSLNQIAPDRVSVSGVKGAPPPPTLKVAMNSVGGYRLDLGIALVGLDVEAKAALVERAFWVANPFPPEAYTSVFSETVRTDKADPTTNPEAVAEWRITLFADEEAKVGRSVANAVVEMALATIPGFHGTGGPPRSGRAFGVYTPGSVDRNLITQTVTTIGGSTSQVSCSDPTVTDHPVLPASPVRAVERDWGPTMAVPIGTLLGARSGDKGGDANLGVFSRSQEAFDWLDQFLTLEQFGALLPETVGLTVERYRLPNVWSLNFVIRGLLGLGVAASSRQDPQAKGLGEWLRSRHVEVPIALLGASVLATLP